MPRAARSARALITAERRAEVIRMRRSRASFEEIGRALGVSRQRAHAIYSRALAAIPAPDAMAHRAEELALIDDAISDLLKLARDHSRPRYAVEAWNAIARYVELEARLLDLFPPAKSRVHVITQDMVEAEIARLEADLGVKAEDLLPRALPPGQGVSPPPFDDLDAMDVDPYDEGS